MKNRYKVPIKQWRYWGERAQATFCEVYSLMMQRQELFTHPQAIKQKAQHWKTVAWNTAWIAADQVQGHLLNVTIKLHKALRG